MKDINLKKLGHFYFIVLFIGAILFYKERTLYMDCAYYIFNIINTKTFFIGSSRYSAVIPEIFPLCCVWLKAPLPVVLTVFSLSYVLLYYIIFLICVYVFKIDDIIIPVMLILTVFSIQSYFHIDTETHQGFMYSLLLFSWMTYYNKLIRKRYFLFWVVTLVIAVLCYFAHPVTLFLILFIFVFFILNDRKNPAADKRKSFLQYAPPLLIIISLFAIRVITTPKNSYDGQFYSQLTSNIGWSFFTLHPLKYAFFHYIIYASPVVIFGMIIFFYRKRRDKVRLLFLVASCVCFFVIVQLSYGKGDADVMMEKDFMPYAVFLGIPLLDLFSNSASVKEKKLIMIVLAISLGIGFINEIRVSGNIRNRINFYHELSYFANEHDERKILLPESCAPNNAINWALGPETLLYSSLSGKENSMTAFINDGDTSKLDDTNLYLSVPFWKYLSEKDLNENYFDLKHQKYVNVSCEGDTCHISP